MYSLRGTGIPKVLNNSVYKILPWRFRAVFLLAGVRTKSGSLEVDQELDMGCQLLTRTFSCRNCRVFLAEVLWQHPKVSSGPKMNSSVMIWGSAMTTSGPTTFRQNSRQISERPIFRDAPDTFNFLRHVMSAIWSVRPKCSHRCVSLKETP